MSTNKKTTADNMIQPCSSYRLPLTDIMAGAAGIPRSAGVSGDNYICRYISEHIYAAALSDGMGTGRRASECSRFLLTSLFRILKQKRDAAQVLDILNSACLSYFTDEYFATLDFAVFNLEEGICSIYKCGAAPAIIGRGAASGIISLPSLPLGIFEKPLWRSVSFEVEHGDCLVLISDGVSEAFPENLPLSHALKFISEKPSADPRSISEHIVTSARSYCRKTGRPPDDMTAVTIKII